MGRGIGLLMIGLLVAGCATVGNPAVKDQAVLDQILVGTSQKADVSRLLGQPTSTSIMNHNGLVQEWWIYSYAKHEANPLMYVPVVGLFVMASGDMGQTESASFGVYFDRDGLVQGVTRDSSQVNLGGLTTPAIMNSHSQTTIGGQIHTETHTQAPSR